MRIGRYLAVTAFCAAMTAGAPAWAGSDGCIALDSGGLDIPTSGASETLAGLDLLTGETITATATSIASNTSLDIDLNGVAVASSGGNVIQPFVETFSFTVATDGVQSMVLLTPGGPVSWAFTCSAAGASSSGDVTTEQTAAAQRVGSARASTNLTAGLILSRIAKITRTTVAFGNRSVAQGVLGLDTGRGAAAGDDGSGLSVWGDMAWTGFREDTSTLKSEGDSYAGTVGADYALSDRLFVGAALTFGGAEGDAGRGAAAVSTDEFSFGVAPYISYAPTDVFFFNGVMGYSRAWGDVDTVTGSGDSTADRWFGAAGATAAPKVGSFFLTTSAELFFGQAFESSVALSDGTRLAGVDDHVGRFSVLFQPSYDWVVDADRGLFLEPYASFGYGVDFTRNELAGSANDRDSFGLGGGMRMYLGESFSGGVEFETRLGLENSVDRSVRGTVRYGF